MGGHHATNPLEQNGETKFSIGRVSGQGRAETGTAAVRRADPLFETSDGGLGSGVALASGFHPSRSASGFGQTWRAQGQARTHLEVPHSARSVEVVPISRRRFGRRQRGHGSLLRRI